MDFELARALAENRAFYATVQRTVREDAEAALDQAADPEDRQWFLAFMRARGRAADRLIAFVTATAAERGAVPGCAAGCHYCCFQEPEVTEAEAVFLAETLKRLYGAEGVARLQTALRKTEEKTAGLSREQRLAERIPCVFLHHRRCAIYPLRPLSCRAHLSTAQRACASHWRRPSGGVPVPILVVPKVAAALLLRQSEQVLHLKAGYPPPRRGALTPSLRRWLEEDRPFQAWREERQRPPPTAPAHR